ncbi:MAG: Xaa-Pro peptidase family protein [Acidimicrobiales bacterium]
MSSTSRHRPKIGYRGAPASDELLDYGELNLHALGPDQVLLDEWASAGLSLPDRPAIRRYRIERVREQLRANDVDGILLYDPLNIRYATDSTNMSIWTMHNQARYCFVPTEGPVTLFEFSHGEFLSSHSEVVDEIRPCTSYQYFYAGNRSVEIAGKWADEIVQLLVEHGGGDKRLAIDMLELEGIRALEERGVTLASGMFMMEDARTVKSFDEITAMRCAAHACMSSIDEMRAIFEPGVTELALWAKLQEANFRRYGEWIETRLLASGPRTNPWYQEASGRVVESGDLMGFDTDMVGAYGACIDMSRTWLCGDAKPSARQASTFSLATEQIDRNIGLHTAGKTLREITERSWYPSIEDYNCYTVLSHGVGLCDEFPSTFTRELWDRTGHDGVLEAGMVMCVESFVGPKSGGEGVKLEQQVLVTDGDPELLTPYSMQLDG